MVHCLFHFILDYIYFFSRKAIPLLYSISRHRTIPELHSIYFYSVGARKRQTERNAARTVCTYLLCFFSSPFVRYRSRFCSSPNGTWIFQHIWFISDWHPESVCDFRFSLLVFAAHTHISQLSLSLSLFLRILSRQCIHVICSTFFLSSVLCISNMAITYEMRWNQCERIQKRIWSVQIFQRF